jgi:hypothetical protein
MTEIPRPNAHNTQQPQTAETRLADMQDRARFTLDTTAMFGSDTEVLQALADFHHVDMMANSRQARQHPVGSQERARAERQVSDSNERKASYALPSETGEMTPDQAEKVAQMRADTKEVVADVAIGGETGHLERIYGDGTERFKKHVDFYKSLATQAVKEAKPLG